jgi:hypothetical protein
VVTATGVAVVTATGVDTVGVARTAATGVDAAGWRGVVRGCRRGVNAGTGVARSETGVATGAGPIEAMGVSGPGAGAGTTGLGRVVSASKRSAAARVRAYPAV